ncbi:hypothetical protein [Protofrankia symbiont of Coriaria ruscifolia]|uniref:hypothetical protein n=1 Tax=Protofrankia symbiont of Coriaria ruscifolia TaxID=1306542 RepID=UPI001A943AE7|nr:hypothetical protein [Protofrankia symbiont of Coriaria ruscifolia]
MLPVTLTAANPTAAGATAAMDLTCTGSTSPLAPLTPLPSLAPVTQTITTTKEPAEGTSPRLRLITTRSRTGEIVHGRGGPSSCGCRECTMARHPAALPRLTVVR